MATVSEELKNNILKKPLYRQPELKEFFPVSDSCFEQGRCGRGALAGLKFSRLGRMVVYSADDLIDFLESLQSFSHTTQADAAKRKAVYHD